jgi:hypothetical protein
MMKCLNIMHLISCFKLIPVILTNLRKKKGKINYFLRYLLTGES